MAPVRLISIGSVSAAQEAANAQAKLEFDGARSYRENKEQWENEFEKRYLGWLMERAQGNISRAACFDDSLAAMRTARPSLSLWL